MSKTEPLRAAFGMKEFAAAHGISLRHVMDLIREGRGPRTFFAGRRRLISAEAAAEWRANAEASANKSPSETA